MGFKCREMVNFLQWLLVLQINFLQIFCMSRGTNSRVIGSINISGTGPRMTHSFALLVVVVSGQTWSSVFPVM